METQTTQIKEALDAFFKEDSSEVVEYMEALLYDWYQHYAVDHYHIEHINKMVNAAFKVNDLLLKLNDAMQAARADQERKSELSQKELRDYWLRA
jgi:hypothetical protein